jgi:hypothetical protein
VRRFGQEALDKILEEALNRTALDAIGDRYFSSTPVEREAFIRKEFTAEIPPLKPITMLTTLAGKALKREEAGSIPMNVTLFPNIEYMERYIKAKANASQEDFIVNGILMMDAYHAVHVFCIKSKNSLSCMVIDSLGGEGSRSIKIHNQLENLGKNLQLTVEILQSRSEIQITSTGCKIISSYLGEKLSRLTVESAKELYDSLNSKADETHDLQAADFPLWLGILLIAQSMPLIKNMKEELSETELMAPVNKRGEKFDTVLAYGLAKKFSTDFYNHYNPTINKTLERKATHQAEHALKTLAMTDEKIMESMARVLGLDVTSKDWREELKSLEGDLGDWKKLNAHKPS